MTKISVECTKVVIYTKNTTLSTIRAAAYDITASLLRELESVILEPIMKLKLEIPTTYSAPVIRDFNGKRRGTIVSVESDGDFTKIEGKAALETLFGYSGEFRSICRGAGEWSMELFDYEPITKDHELNQK